MLLTFETRQNDIDEIFIAALLLVKLKSRSFLAIFSDKLALEHEK